MIAQIGNFIAISATLFLIGPRRQCQKMFDKTRRFSTIIWLCEIWPSYARSFIHSPKFAGTLIITFSIAVAGVNAGWVVFMLLIQICASVWYSASYIPYGRRFIIKLFQSTCFKPCESITRRDTRPLQQSFALRLQVPRHATLASRLLPRRLSLLCALLPRWGLRAPAPGIISHATRAPSPTHTKALSLFLPSVDTRACGHVLCAALSTKAGHSNAIGCPDKATESIRGHQSERAAPFLVAEWRVRPTLS